MTKFWRCLLTVSLLSYFVFSQHALSESQTPKGKIIIVVIDVSVSIENQLENITQIVDRAIVQNRLDVGDYFVLMSFGETTKQLYAGQLLRDEDKLSISNTLHSMKATDRRTDTGSAIKETLRQIVDLKTRDFNLYEPLVLFVTDGEIYTREESPFFNQTVEEIFSDSLISNIPLYNGWYFVGIRVEEDLHDLPKIAELSERSDYLLMIEDLDNLEFELGDFISKIPNPELIEEGEIIFDNFKLGRNKINEKRNVVVSSSNMISFNMASTYVRTPVVLEFLEANAIFQSQDKNSTIPIKINTEAGKINIAPLGIRESSASFMPDAQIHGKGTLKIEMSAIINGLPENYSYTFEIEAKTPQQILFSKVFIPLLIVIIILIVAVAVIVIKKFLPVKIAMEIVGKPVAARAVTFKLNKKVDFGSKPGLVFKLDSEQFSSVVGQLQRAGANKWQIIPRDKTAFDSADAGKNLPYKLGELLKLKTKDESTVTIRFKKK